MNIKFFHADDSSYFFLDRLLIVPFGYNYVNKKPSPKERLIEQLRKLGVEPDI